MSIPSNEQPNIPPPFSGRRTEYQDSELDLVLNVENYAKRTLGTKTPSPNRLVHSQIDKLDKFYDEVFNRAQRSFDTAIWAGIAGLLFFFATTGYLIFVNKSIEIAIVGVISGALLEFISGIFLYIYGQATSQLTAFHNRLEMTQRILIADGLCENLKEGDLREQTRASIAKSILTMPTQAKDKETIPSKIKMTAKKKKPSVSSITTERDAIEEGSEK